MEGYPARNASTSPATAAAASISARLARSAASRAASSYTATSLALTKPGWCTGLPIRPPPPASSASCT